MKKTTYASHRSVVYAQHGMVATTQPLAAQAGLDILKQGGNAIDAAIAVAACLTVVEPTSNGIGGDNFALVWYDHKLYGLNSSGHAPKGLSIDSLKENGLKEMPRFGFAPVTVPGAVAGWAELSRRFGRLSLSDVLKPAVTYAKTGFTVSPTVAYYWQRAVDIYKKVLTDDMFKYWFDTFTKDGVAPNEGDLWMFPDHAKTLESIGSTEGKSFYEGTLADQIDEFSKKHKGFISKSDLASFKPEWVMPISTSYRGHDVWELPPNGQGLVALLGLNIIKHLSIGKKETLDTYHKQIEAVKLAFADGLAYIGDPKSMDVSTDALLSSDYAKKRAKRVTKNASFFTEGDPTQKGTVYLATADKDGHMVSLIQSNYMGFGSGLVVPHTGIALHNRGHNFSMDPASPNFLKPNKKPFHTIIPGFITKNNEGIGPFGVMGGFMQPQGHLQVIMNLLDFNLNPQEALDAPRFQWMTGKKIIAEPDLSRRIFNGLLKRGHDIHVEHELGQFGRGQIILRNPKTGVYCGGTEKRADGSIASY